MRRFFLAATILSIVASGPLQALAGDREIAEQIIQRLKVQRDAGSLKGFTLDLKVDKGVVLLRGSVRQAAQKQDVLAVAKGIEGITQVVDEITVAPTQDVAAASAAPATPSAATVIRPKASIAAAPAPATTAKSSSDNFSFKKALAAANAQKENVAPQSAVAQAHKPAPWAAPGSVEMAAAVESDSTTVDSDRAITSSVVSALGTAQRQGRLKGFGVDVNTQDGRVYVTGRASSEEHRQLITNLARQTAGVVDVVDEIAVYDSAAPIPEPVIAGEANEPEPLSQYAPNLTPVAVEPVSRPGRPGTPAIAASARPMGVPAQAVPYQMQQGGPVQAMPANYPMQGGAVGCPVPMAPYAGGAAAPRYEQPYLPNYAWPGYAAYPNYAAVSYPQQYSPSAFPYIGPFYPYPQVPLGWRKVSLEWDDGWWMLDFTDR